MRALKTNGLFTAGLAGLKPPRPARGTTPTGSRILGLGQEPIVIGYGPGDAPAQFRGGTTSISEWYIYWALEQVRGPEGEANWSYQQSFLGGRRVTGGAIVDFVLWEKGYAIGLRIQTFYFHLASPLQSEKQAADLEQKVALQDGTDLYVVDIYEQNYIHDPSGTAAKRQVVLAQELVEYYNPRSSGEVRP
jgi:hypothetical protein